MQQLLKAPTGTAGAEVVSAELLVQLLVAVHDPESASNLRLGRVSLSSADLSARKEGRLSKSPWRAISDLRSTCRPSSAGEGVPQGDEDDLGLRPKGSFVSRWTSSASLTKSLDGGKTRR